MPLLCTRLTSPAIVAVRRFVLVCVLAWVAAACDPGSSKNVYVEGELTWTEDRRTLLSCENGATYLVFVVASNPNFYLYYRVQELEAKNPGMTVLAKVDGTLKPVPSPAPAYPVDAALYVNRIHSIEEGSCE